MTLLHSQHAALCETLANVNSASKAQAELILSMTDRADLDSLTDAVDTFQFAYPLWYAVGACEMLTVRAALADVIAAQTAAERRYLSPAYTSTVRAISRTNVAKLEVLQAQLDEIGATARTVESV